MSLMWPIKTDVVAFICDVSRRLGHTFSLCRPVIFTSRHLEIPDSSIEKINTVWNSDVRRGSPSTVQLGSRAGASSPCTESCMATGGGRLLGMREGPTVPRVLITADPTYFSSLSHPFVSAYRRFAYTHTNTTSSIHPYAPAQPCGAMHPRCALSRSSLLTDQSLGLYRSTTPYGCRL